MHNHRLLPRLRPAVQVRQNFQHLKRQVGSQLDPDEPGFSLTEPLTFTVVKTKSPTSTAPPNAAATPTLTPLNTLPVPTPSKPGSPGGSAPASPNSVPPSQPSQPPGNSQAPSQAPSQAQPRPTNTSTGVTPSPSKGLDQSNDKPNVVATGAAKRGSGISGGAIAAVVIVILLLVFGVGFFFIRKRFMNKRLKKRSWGPPVMGGALQAGGDGLNNRDISTVERGRSSPLTMAVPQIGGVGNTYTQSSPPPNTYTLPLPPPTYNNSGAPSLGSLSPSTSSPFEVASNRAATVQCTFIPTLPDELSITTGETVRLLAEYDDGWGLCSNSQGERGMVPLECLGIGHKFDRSSKRASSLAGAQFT